MILLISEDNFEDMSASIKRNLDAKGIDNRIVLQNTLPVQNNITLFAKNGKLKGCFLLDGETIDIQDITAIYTRFGAPFYDSSLKEKTLADINTERIVCFNTIFEYIDAMVVNKNSSQFSNSSKLYQSYIIKQYGFNIPESIVSNDINAVKKFIEKHKKDAIIYKSASSERSKVQKLTKEDYKNIEFIKYCPHLFQKCIEGKDIRVHALATGETFACEINTQTSDYRYDKERNIEIIELPEKIKQACVKMTVDMGLFLSGIDLRKTADDEYYCFEVNPSPAFTWYEMQTGLPITNAVADMMINAHKYKNKVARKF